MMNARNLVLVLVVVVLKSWSRRQECLLVVVPSRRKKKSMSNRRKRNRDNRTGVIVLVNRLGGDVEGRGGTFGVREKPNARSC